MLKNLTLYISLYFIIAIRVRQSLLLWISLDGFRQDYFNEEDTPNMFALFTNKGVVSKEHKPLFSTKTFPNHFSQITGLTQEHHGIINNDMFDETLGYFNKGTTDIRWWDPDDINTPIWTINQINGGSSAVIHWVSSPVAFKGVLPDFYFESYNQSCNFTCRIDYTIEQIKSDERNLVMVYSEEVDSMGHRVGPDSPERIETTKIVDAEIGRLLNELEKMDKLDKINIMISSDHGMTLIPRSNHINVANLLNGFNYKTISTGTLYQITCDEETALAIQTVLKEVPNISAVYLKDEIPDNYRYKNNKHVPILTALPADNYVILESPFYISLGDHGYPIEESPNMIAFFGVAGPSINNETELEMTDQTDLFKIACEILDLSRYCQDTDGTLPIGLVKVKDKSRTIALVIALPIVIVILIIAGMLGAYYGLRNKKLKSNA